MQERGIAVALGLHPSIEVFGLGELGHFVHENDGKGRHMG
jgi:hypothetical protein